MYVFVRYVLRKFLLYALRDFFMSFFSHLVRSFVSYVGSDFCMSLVIYVVRPFGLSVVR